MAKANGTVGKTTAEQTGVTRITVAGFKSIGWKRSIDVRPLTILAGANSSGKSSIMQPFLLLKQTLEAPYDPGALLLDGPNVKFSRFEEMLFRTMTLAKSGFTVGVAVGRDYSLTVRFSRHKRDVIGVRSMLVESNGTRESLEPGATEFDPSRLSKYRSMFVKNASKNGWPVTARIARRRCFLEQQVRLTDPDGGAFEVFDDDRSQRAEAELIDALHLPGLRGNPQRTYPVASPGPLFPGTFDNYVASIVTKAVDDGDTQLLKSLGSDLQALGLTWKVIARKVNDAAVEILVARPPAPSQSGTKDLVNIVDVGFGVSQTLPVVVALRVAKPGQLVYIEQPEIHLHPRAQVAMAGLLVNAAKRGVRVVAETHSSLLLVGVQSLVAEGVLPPEGVVLHWFRRNPKDGSTDVISAGLDRSGAYGDWPQDFADVELGESIRYTRAAFEQLKAARDQPRNGTHGKASPTPTGD